MKHDTDYTSMSDARLIKVETDLQNKLEKKLDKKSVAVLRKLEEVQRELTLRETE